jgi:hypothetical protein
MKIIKSHQNSLQTQQQPQQQQQQQILKQYVPQLPQSQPIPTQQAPQQSINAGATNCSTSPTNGSPSGQISKKVTVPYQVVGLVVGPKGSTIKRIQQTTNTYIVTPSRDSQPVFEIQGQADCVEAAKVEIENYIMLRTNQPGGGPNSSSSSSSSSSSASSSCSSKDDFCCSLSGLMISDNGHQQQSTQQQSHLPNGMNEYVANLISPQSTSLFQSVASVVDDDVMPNGKCSADLGVFG